MSEIRSTIEIMMERTRGMGLSESEKAQIHRDSLQKKARGYALKIHDYSDTANKIIDELYAESPDDLEELKKLVWNLLVQKIEHGQNLTQFLDLIEKLPFAPPQKTVISKFRSELKNAQKDKSKDRKTLMDRERKKLADYGISGSSVVPIISKDTENKGINEVIDNLKAELTI